MFSLVVKKKKREEMCLRHVVKKTNEFTTKKFTIVSFSTFLLLFYFSFSTKKSLPKQGGLVGLLFTPKLFRQIRGRFLSLGYRPRRTVLVQRH